MKFTRLILSGLVLPVLMLNNSLLPHTKDNLPAPIGHIQVNFADRTPMALPAITDSALNNFAATLKDGDAEKVVGVYVSGVLTLRVAQQPINNPAYINSALGYATQFSLATKYGSTGLLAHNYLSGALFFNLLVGQEVDVIYGDGFIRRYTISSIRHLQALNPTSPISNFVDLDSNGAQITNADLFSQIYGKADRVIFQTCIHANGNTSWGRLFVIATPIL